MECGSSDESRATLFLVVVVRELCSAADQYGSPVVAAVVLVPERSSIFCATGAELCDLPITFIHPPTPTSLCRGERISPPHTDMHNLEPFIFTRDEDYSVCGAI